MKRNKFPGMPGNMNSMMKQVQEMQRKMEEAQAKLDETEIAGSAGGGMIEAVVTGKKELVRIKIKPDVVDPEDVEMLEDLIVAAVGDAMRKAEEIANSEMSKLTGGINIPGF